MKENNNNNHIFQVRISNLPSFLCLFMSCHSCVSSDLRKKQPSRNRLLSFIIPISNVTDRGIPPSGSLKNRARPPSGEQKVENSMILTGPTRNLY